MKTTISKSDFRDAFHHCGRGDQFSYDALGLIFDYFEEYEQATGEEVELDPIGVCCVFAEDDPEDIANNYQIDISSAQDDEEILEIVKSYIEENSTYLGKTKSGLVVYIQF